MSDNTKIMLNNPGNHLQQAPTMCKVSYGRLERQWLLIPSSPLLSFPPLSPIDFGRFHQKLFGCQLGLNVEPLKRKSMPTSVHLGNDRDDAAIQKVFLPLISKEKPENDERRELVTTCSKLVAVKMRILALQLGNNPNSVNSLQVARW